MSSTNWPESSSAGYSTYSRVMSMGSTGIPYEYAFPVQPLQAMGLATGTKRRADDVPNTRSVKAKTENSDAENSENAENSK